MTGALLALGLTVLASTPDAPVRGVYLGGSPLRGQSPRLAEAAPIPTVDGHPRHGEFLSGPGSLTFIVHHTALLGLGGLGTQLTGSNAFTDFNIASREAALAGMLIGAGVGFGVSSWWQYDHWVGVPAAGYGVVHSVFGGMMFAGLLDLVTRDPTALTWTALAGAELGAWLTVLLGGGDMAGQTGHLTTSGGLWSAVYAALAVSIVSTMRDGRLSFRGAQDALLIAPGVGAGLAALLSVHFEPSHGELMRANLVGAGAGALAFAATALALGTTHKPAPYWAAGASAAAGMGSVALFWRDPPAGGGKKEQPVAAWW